MRVLLSGLMACGLMAQTPAPRRNPFLISRPVPDPSAVERGKNIFVPSCGFCHVALRDENGEEIGPVIHAGRPGMPAFAQMPDEQIKDIAAFLRFRQQAAIDRGAYAVKDVNTGDAGKGQAYFSAHCATCHASDLKGVSAKYQPIDLITRILYPRGVKPAVTVTVGGKSVSGTLDYLDDFEIGLRDAAGEYHAFTRGPAVTMVVRDPLEAHEKQMKTFQDADLHNVLAYLETLK